MGKIRKIYEDEIKGTGFHVPLYPVTHVRAVFDDNNQTLEAILASIYKDLERLDPLEEGQEALEEDNTSIHKTLDLIIKTGTADEVVGKRVSDLMSQMAQAQSEIEDLQEHQVNSEVFLTPTQWAELTKDGTDFSALAEDVKYFIYEDDDDSPSPSPTPTPSPTPQVTTMILTTSYGIVFNDVWYLEGVGSYADGVLTLPV